MTALLDRPGSVAVLHDVDQSAPTPRLRRRVLSALGQVEDSLVDLGHPCAGCAVREDAVPTIERLLGEERWDAIVLALPPGADILPASRTLAEQTGPTGWLRRGRVAAAVAVANPMTTISDLFDGETLAERGMALAPEDPRTVGEALLSQVCSADLVLLLDCGPEPSAMAPAVADDERDESARSRDPGLIDAPDAELRRRHSCLVIDALRAPGSWRHDDAMSPWIARALDFDHDDLEIERRLDPLTLGPGASWWESSGRNGVDGGDEGAAVVWQLDLRSPRPVHPERLLACLESLFAGPQVSRGRFWVPNRPDSVCGWEGAGGQLSIGVAGEWGTVEAETRLFVVGVGAHRREVRAAFEAALLTDDEWTAGPAAWLDRSDPLEQYLGPRTADRS